MHVEHAKTTLFLYMDKCIKIHGKRKKGIQNAYLIFFALSGFCIEKEECGVSMIFNIIRSAVKYLRSDQLSPSRQLKGSFCNTFLKETWKNY